MRLADATAVTSVAEGRYVAELHEGWDIMGIVNGGYMMAVAGRAMTEEASGRSLVSLTGHFLNPGTAGRVEVEVTELKAGSSFTTSRAVMASDGKPLLAVTGTLGARLPGPGETRLMAGSPPELPDPDECVRAAWAEGSFFPPPIVDRVDMRIHPEDATGMLGGAGGSARVRGWLRLLNGEPMDALTIVLTTDVFPPAIFNTDLPMTWTPTLDLTVHIRNSGPHEWLKTRFRTRFVTGGFLEEDGDIWDDQGNLVALSRQLALVGR